MQPYDFENSVIFWVIQTSHVLERAFNDELAPHGITWSQCQVLGWLAHDGEQSQAELADRMRIEASTLAGILDRMERDGWVERRPATDDRRRKIVRPTAQSDSVWSRITRCALAVRGRATTGIDPAELRHMFELLAKIQQNCADAP